MKRHLLKFLATHSVIGFVGEFDVPFTEKATNKMIGKINEQRSFQQTAATSAQDILWQADFQGTIADLYVTLNGEPGAGESMVYDVWKFPAGGGAGASILTAPVTMSATTATQNQQNSLYASINPVDRTFNVGDTFYVYRTYTAGTPTPIGPNTLIIEPAPKPWK